MNDAPRYSIEPSYFMEIWKKWEPLLSLPAWKSRTQPLKLALDTLYHHWRWKVMLIENLINYFLCCASQILNPVGNFNFNDSGKCQKRWRFHFIITFSWECMLYFLWKLKVQHPDFFFNFKQHNFFCPIIFQEIEHLNFRDIFEPCGIE